MGNRVFVKCTKGHDLQQENPPKTKCPYCLEDELKKAKKQSKLWKRRFIVLATIMINDCTLKRKTSSKAKKNFK